MLLSSNLSQVVMLVLAQATPDEEQVLRRGKSAAQQADIYFWLMMIVAVAVVLGLAGYFLYQRLKKEVKEPSPSLDAAFSLSEMRRLYESGEISHDEYMTIRNKLLGPAKAAMLGEGEPAKAEAMEAPSSSDPQAENPGELSVTAKPTDAGLDEAKLPPDAKLSDSDDSAPLEPSESDEGETKEDEGRADG